MALSPPAVFRQNGSLFFQHKNHQKDLGALWGPCAIELRPPKRWQNAMPLIVQDILHRKKKHPCHPWPVHLSKRGCSVSRGEVAFSRMRSTQVPGAFGGPQVLGRSFSSAVRGFHLVFMSSLGNMNPSSPWMSTGQLGTM